MTQQTEQLLVHTSGRAIDGFLLELQCFNLLTHLYSSHTGHRQTGNLHQDDPGTQNEEPKIYVCIIY